MQRIPTLNGSSKRAFAAVGEFNLRQYTYDVTGFTVEVSCSCCCFIYGHLGRLNKSVRCSRFCVD